MLKKKASLSALLLIIAIACWFVFRRNGYTLYAVIDNIHSVEPESVVRLEGKEIGHVEKTHMLAPHKVLLTLSIDNDVKIPFRDLVIYRESLLGNAEIDILKSAAPGLASGYMQASDTLKGTYEPNYQSLDEMDKKRIQNRLGDLVKTVDSVLHKKK